MGYDLDGPGLAISDFDLRILYMLAVFFLSANSKQAFLLTSTAQLISYELTLISAILLVILLSGSLAVDTEMQIIIWYVVPLLPVFIIFFIASLI